MGGCVFEAHSRARSRAGANHTPWQQVPIGQTLTSRRYVLRQETYLGSYCAIGVFELLAAEYTKLFRGSSIVENGRFAMLTLGMPRSSKRVIVYRRGELKDVGVKHLLERRRCESGFRQWDRESG